MIEEKHQGHDLMHAEMILILFGSIMVAQILLFLWRQKHGKSYQVEYTELYCRGLSSASLSIPSSAGAQPCWLKALHHKDWQ